MSALEPRVVGAVVLYRLYDVGYEIDLERALDFLATSPEEREALRLKLERRRRAEAQAIRIKNPPVTIALGRRATGSRRAPPRRAGLGAHLRLRRDLPADAIRPPGCARVVRVRRVGDSAELLEAAKAPFDRRIEQLAGRIAPAIVRPQIAPVSEDYVVYRITRLENSAGEALPASAVRDLDVAPLLLNEDRPISEQARKELLPHWFSYYPDDLSIITWNTALVLDPAEGESDSS